MSRDEKFATLLIVGLVIMIIASALMGFFGENPRSKEKLSFDQKVEIEMHRQEIERRERR